MDFVVSPSREVLMSFEDNLWKDKRIIRLDDLDGAPRLSKSRMTTSEVSVELAVIEELRSDERCSVPKVLSWSDDELCLSYTKGSRLFNVFVELDRLPVEYLDQAARAKSLLIERAKTQEALVQNHLYRIRDSLGETPYPVHRKTSEILTLLSHALAIKFPDEKLQSELREFEAEWASLCVVPFRDATPKNILLADPALWLGSFDGEDDRREFIRNRFADSFPDVPDFLYAPLVDFDFGSCAERSTPEDDPISLLAHQRTWNADIVDPQKLVWLEHHSANARRCALSFIVRYGRFGGRKAAYRLLHNNGFRVRFRHDDDRFYFDRIVGIVAGLCESLDSAYPLILELLDLIGKRLAVTHPLLDYFRDYNRSATREYYVDIFPY